MLLLVTAASAPPPSHEAVCGLRGLFTAEMAHFQERDRFGMPQQVGFLPLPCTDGSRPSTSGPESVGGCRFVFKVLEAGQGPDALKAEARGAGAGAEGLHFVVDSKGTITRGGTGAPVPVPDCEEWRKQADPLWRYHDAVAEHDCIGGPYAPSHPCATALAELAALAKAGVGVAKREYEAHPTARELVPLEPPSSALQLCGVKAPPEQRLQAAESLEREGRLLEAVLAPRCHDEGLRAALPRLLQRFDAVCPGPHCLKLLEFAKRVGMPGREALLKTHASQVARLLQAQPPPERKRLLEAVVGLSYPHAAALEELLVGRWPGLPALEKLPREPVVLALVDLARGQHPSLAAPLALLNELQGQGTVSAGTFRAWAESSPCEKLSDVDLLQVTGARLREVARNHQRCHVVVQVLRRHTEKLPPRELMEALEPLPPEYLHMLTADLGLDVPERAVALVDWVVEREPRLLDAIHGNAAVVRRLLAPGQVNRLGGRDAVLDYLLKQKGTWRGTLSDDALRVVVSEALRGQPPVERVRHVSSLLLVPEEKLTWLAPALRAPDSRVRAAAGAGLAEWEGASIPADAARACLTEVRVFHRCVEAEAARLGPPPPGKRTLQLIGRSIDPRQAPLETWCMGLEKALASCGTVCGGRPPMGDELKRLRTAAGERLEEPEALRACTWTGP
ncbi:hypothetical protein HPC49_28095 [Pyxidicoccus fallax]|nr:hypothetical protein [Pyxidicoccus fallax]